MNRRIIEKWYAKHLGKTVEEFDEYDKHITKVVYTFHNEQVESSSLCRFFIDKGIDISVIQDRRFEEYDVYYYVINDYVIYAPNDYVYSSQKDGVIHAKTRSQAETEAFEAAFKILNDRLK
jgi:hypothetical protein